MEQMNVAEEQKLSIDYTDGGYPFSVRRLRPLMYREGNKVHVVLGPDLRTGHHASADTLYEALIKWDHSLQQRLQGHEESELIIYVRDSLGVNVYNVG